MRRRKLPPWSRHHEEWCAVYRGEPCDCDNDTGGRKRRPKPSPLQSGGVTPKQEKELEDA
jgi:hypothetical protein